MAGTLPPELISYIFSFLLNDKRTLVASATVCRAWTFPSECALVHHTCISPAVLFGRNRDDPELTSLWEQGSPNPSNFLIHEFVDLIAKYPVLAKHVRVLTIRTANPLDESFCPNIVYLLSLLSGLTHLTLEVLDDPKDVQRYRAIVASIMDSFQGHPRLCDVQVYMNHIWPDLFMLFVGTNIRRLTLVEDDPSLKWSDSHAPPWNSILLSIQELHLSLSDNSLLSFCDSDLLRHVMPHLKSLHFTLLVDEEVSMLNSVLARPNAIPLSVKSLTITMGSDPYEFPVLDLRKVSVEHLCFDCAGVWVRWCMKALDLLPPSHPVKKITLAFESPRVHPNQFQDIDTVISRLDVYEVDFIHKKSRGLQHDGTSPLKEAIRAAFPSLERKGVLRL